jgi:hypothetical protein
MDSKTVRYARMGEVVVLKFPEEQGAKDFIMRIETQDLLAKITKGNMPVAPMKPSIGTPLKPRVAA